MFSFIEGMLCVNPDKGASLCVLQVESRVGGVVWFSSWCVRSCHY